MAAEQDKTFLLWLEKHGGILRRTARSFAVPDEQAELYQDLLVALWEAVPAFRGEAQPSTYIYRVAHNRALVWSRERRQRRMRFTALPPDIPAASSGPDATRVDELYRAIHALPPVDRSLALLYLDDLSYREIATVPGITESNVGVRLHRLRQRLSELLKAGDS